jgi:hypothetical protein
MVKSGQVAALYILIHIGVIFFLYPGNLLEAMESGHWVAVLVGFLVHILIVWGYMWGLGRFERGNVIDIYLRLGKWLASLIMLPVFFYLLVAVVIATRAYGEIITLLFLSSTPLWAIMALILAVSLFLAIQGIATILRASMLLLVLCLPPTLFVLVSSFQHVDWHYLLPFIDRESFSWSFLYGRPFLMSLFAVGGSFLFLGFLQPEIAFDQLKLRYASFAILPMLLIAIYVPLLTFGHSTASTFLFPFIMVTDIVEVNWLMFERTSLFFTLSMIAFALLFMSLTLWNAVYMIQRVVKIKPILVGAIICVLLYVVCVFIDDWEHLESLLWWNTLLRLYIMFVIPAGTIALAIRHRGKGAAPHAQGQ